MAGQASGGQTLTPNRNVIAPAGRGGDRWGAFGGGITPVGVGKPLAATLSDGETANNYQDPAQSLGEQVSRGVQDRNALDTSIPGGGSNQG